MQSGLTVCFCYGIANEWWLGTDFQLYYSSLWSPFIITLICKGISIRKCSLITLLMVSKWEDYARIIKEGAESAPGLATVTTAEAGWAMLNW